MWRRTFLLFLVYPQKLRCLIIQYNLLQIDSIFIVPDRYLYIYIAVDEYSFTRISE